MPTPAPNRFNSFTKEAADGNHNFASHTIKVALTNTAPVATNTVISDITQIASGNGYTTGGIALTGVSISRSGHVVKVLADDVIFQASGGTMATFRYAVLYNTTNNKLIMWFDEGSSVSLTSGYAYKIDFDNANGFLGFTTGTLGSFFQYFNEGVLRGEHNLSSDTLKVMLCSAITSSGGSSMSDVTEISAGSGYSTGGGTISGYTSQTYNTDRYRLTSAGVANTIVTASGGNITYTYAVLYNSTKSKPIMYFTYTGSSQVRNGKTLELYAADLFLVF